MITIHTANDVTQWVENGNFDALMPLTPDEAVVQGASLADTIFSAFRRVFPVYLWAVADDYQTLVERYLSAEFPVDDVDEDEPSPTPYYRTDFLRHTHLTEARADELRAMVEDKRQAIFYGPPGTGKTYVAKHLARLLTGLADPPPDRLTVVQFHPAYGYEEFIEGIRPESVELDGRHHVTYPPRPGIFVEFCRAAERLGDAPCVFIIDEINRGNIPRIFGELMYLLEYRDKQDSIPLPYSARRFRIPPNVYLIGTMNTADRSIALVDFALRRRFHFAHFTADPDLFESWLKVHPSPVPWLGALYRRLTAEAIQDEAFRIGPSVFMRPGLDEAGLRQVWQWSIMPYLNEYYFDQRPRAELWSWDKDLLRSIRGEHAG
jgi:MoxR-like ATPase